MAAYLPGDSRISVPKLKDLFKAIGHIKSFILDENVKMPRNILSRYKKKRVFTIANEFMAIERAIVNCDLKNELMSCHLFHKVPVQYVAYLRNAIQVPEEHMDKHILVILLLFQYVGLLIFQRTYTKLIVCQNFGKLVFELYYFLTACRDFLNLSIIIESKPLIKYSHVHAALQSIIQNNRIWAQENYPTPTLMLQNEEHFNDVHVCDREEDCVHKFGST